jgi:hypothetical protein
MHSSVSADSGVRLVNATAASPGTNLDTYRAGDVDRLPGARDDGRAAVGSKRATAGAPIRSTQRSRGVDQAVPVAGIEAGGAEIPRGSFN